MTDIVCIGHITHDRIITPQLTTEQNGGTAYYFAHSMSHIDATSFELVTSLAASDMSAVEQLQEQGVNVRAIESPATVFFENSYGHNFNNRTQRVLAKAAPFTTHNIGNVSAKYVHLGSLLADDFSLELIESLAAHSKVSVDAQGFLRHVTPTGNVEPCDWLQKQRALQCVSILKVNEHEACKLMETDDMTTAISRLCECGVPEVLLTLGNMGSIVCTPHGTFDIPAYEPTKEVDATGCGDTYCAGYLYMRSQGADIGEAARFAAAMATLKLESTGPFTGNASDVVSVTEGARKAITTKL